MKKSFLVFLIILFSSCSENVSNDKINNPSSSGSKGALTLSFDKTTTPLGVVSVKATLSRIGYTSISKTVNLLSDSAATTTFDSIVVGTWKLNVDAFGNSNQVLYSGLTEVTVVEGVVTQVNLVLKPVSSGVGSIKINVSWGNSITNGLVLYYPFNGNAKDQSGYGYHGTVVGASITTNRFGDSSSAYYFNGVNSIIKSGDILDEVFCAPVAKFTFAGWVKLIATAQYNTVIMSKNAGGTGPYQWGIGFFPSGVLFAGVMSDAAAQNYIILQNTSVQKNQWFHFVFVFDGSQPKAQRLKLYVNGSTVNTSVYSEVGSLGTSTENTSQQITIGANHEPNNPNLYASFGNELLDEIRIYNRVLTSDEVMNLYNAHN